MSVSVGGCITHRYKYGPEIVIKFGALFWFGAKIFTSELNAKFPNR